MCLNSVLPLLIVIMRGARVLAQYHVAAAAAAAASVVPQVRVL